MPRNPNIWRDDPVGLVAADELLPGVAEAFARIATRAVEQGLLQGYRTISDTLPVLRGRILAGEQMSRLYGLPVPIAVEYDDFTVDIAENQLLAMATLRLLTVPRVERVGAAAAAATAPHTGRRVGAAARRRDPDVAAEPTQRPLQLGLAAGRDRLGCRIFRASARRCHRHGLHVRHVAGIRRLRHYRTE